MLKYFFHPAAEKELSRIPLKEQERIIEKLQELCQLSHPLQHQKVIKLGGKEYEEFRLRVGDYRIKFIFRKPSFIFITHIQHRQIGY